MLFSYLKIVGLSFVPAPSRSLPLGRSDGFLNGTANLTAHALNLFQEGYPVLLDLRLQELADRITEHPKVTLTYFQPDKRKAGGVCVTITGRLKKFDEYEGELLLLGGERILIENILSVQAAEA